MVKVSIELSKIQIQMIMNCIDAALDTKHVPEENEVETKDILVKLSKYL